MPSVVAASTDLGPAQRVDYLGGISTTTTTAPALADNVAAMIEYLTELVDRVRDRDAVDLI